VRHHSLPRLVASAAVSGFAVSMIRVEVARLDLPALVPTQQLQALDAYAAGVHTTRVSPHQPRPHSPLPLYPPNTQFLTSQLPARLENHVTRLEALLPSCASPKLADLLAGSAASKSGVLEVSRDWGLLDTSDLKGLLHFESHLAGFKERVEGELARLMAGAQGLAHAGGWFDGRQEDVHALNAALDLTHWCAGCGGWCWSQGQGNRAVLHAGRCDRHLPTSPPPNNQTNT